MAWLRRIWPNIRRLKLKVVLNKFSSCMFTFMFNIFSDEKRSQTFEATKKWEVGDYVVIHGAKPDPGEPYPWISRVEEINNRTLHVVWLKGQYTTKWALADEFEGCNVDKINKKLIMGIIKYWDGTTMLRKTVADALIKAYENVKY